MIELINISFLITIFVLFKSIFLQLSKEQLVRLTFFAAAWFSAFHFVVYLLNLSFYYLGANSFGSHSLIVGYDNIRFLNQLQVMVYPIFLMPFLFSKLEKYKLISLVLASLHWFVLLQMEARGAMLSLIVAFSVILFYLSKKHRALVTSFFFRTLIYAVLLWFIFVVALPFIFFNESSLQVRTSSSGRLDMWLHAIKLIPESPWLGFGPMSYAWLGGRPLANAHPHNSIIQLMYEYGVVLALLILGGLLNWLHNAFNKVKMNANVLDICLFFSILSAVLYSLLSGVIVMPFSQLLLTILIAAVSASNAKDNCYPLRLRYRVIFFIAILIASTVLISSYNHEELKQTGHPRFWINGAISF
ncbi:O-antigen ligase family protein [Pseudomonadota bacterium]